VAPLAYGIPASPPGGGSYDWWPLVLPLVALIVGPLFFKIRLTVRSALAIVAGATVAAWFVGILGLVPAIGAGTLGLAAGSEIQRRSGRRHR
jgi:hypothetical protein